jgi:hypothetical protein
MSRGLEICDNVGGIDIAAMDALSDDSKSLEIGRRRLNNRDAGFLARNTGAGVQDD